MRKDDANDLTEATARRLIRYLAGTTVVLLANLVMPIAFANTIAWSTNTVRVHSSMLREINERFQLGLQEPGPIILEDFLLLIAYVTLIGTIITGSCLLVVRIYFILEKHATRMLVYKEGGDDG